MSPPLAAVLFLLESLGSVVIWVLLVRILLQALGTDYYNPVSQAVVRLAAPVLSPLRRFVPSNRYLNGPALVVLLVAQVLLIYAGALLRGYVPALPGVLLMAIAQPLWLLSLLYLGMLIMTALASWFPGAGGPLLRLMEQLTAPLLWPLRRHLPPMGGLDFSVLAALLIVQVARILLLRPLLESAAGLMVAGL